MSIDGDVNLGDPFNNGSTDAFMELEASGLTSSSYNGDVALPALTLLDGSLEGPMELQPMTVSATGVTGTVIYGDGTTNIALGANGTIIAGEIGVGAVVLPSFESAGSFGVMGAVELPVVTVDAAGLAGTASTGSILFEAYTLDTVLLTNTLSSADLTLPMVVVTATAITGSAYDGDAVLPAFEVNGSAYFNNVLVGALALPVPTIDAVLIHGAVAVGDVELPAHTLLGVATAPPAINAGAGAVELATHVVSAIGLAGTLSSASVALPRLSLAGAASAQGLAAGDIELAMFTVQGVGSASNLGAAVVSLPALALDAVAVAGTASTAEITVPLLEVDAQGSFSTIGTASLILPLLALDGEMTQVELTPVAFTSVVMNTHTRAVTEYDGPRPNSMCWFNDLVLMATEDGIVALSGGTDLGEDIAASATGAVSDFGDDHQKRILCGYVGYRADGDLELTMIADTHQEYVYTLEPRLLDDQHASRVKFGRGVAGRYWQWKLANRDGANFALDALTLVGDALSKRVR